MANAVTTIINVLMQFGLAKFLMREAELSQDVLRSVFTVNVIMSIVYALAIVVGSLASRQLFSSSEVGQFLLVFSIFPLFAMMEFLPAALCSREMRFGLIAALGVVRATVVAAVTILLARKGYAYMSFAWAQVTAWIITSLCFNIIIWRPDLWRFRLQGIREILRFGAQMIGISGITQLGTRAGEMVLGSMLGLSPLGVYIRASGPPSQLHGYIYSSGSNVLFSQLSRDLRESGQISSTYSRFMRLMLGILWPMMLGLAVLSQPLTHILYGPKWQGAATPLAFLSVAYAITIGIGMTSEVFILRHETAKQVRIEALRTTIGLVLFAGGAMISLPAAAAAKVAESILSYCLYRKPMARLVGGPSHELSNIYIESLLLSAGAVLPSFFLLYWKGWSEYTPISMMSTSVLIGVLTWTAILFLRRHPISLELLRIFRVK